MFDRWQLQTDSEILDIDIMTLKKWINEGRITPHHQVRRGRLNWLAAERVPELRSLFPGVMLQPPQELPIHQSRLNAQYHLAADQNRKGQPIYQKEYLPTIVSARCANHLEIKPDFICSECGYSVCGSCAKLVGVRNVPICTRCDGLCHEYRVALERAQLHLDQQKPFGVHDLQLSLRHPLNYLFQITLISAFFGGGLLIGFAGFPLGTMLAYAILFTCTSVIIRRVMVGDQDHRHLFDLSTMLADLGTPVLLGLAILLITTGPYELYYFLHMIEVQQTTGNAFFSLAFSKLSAFIDPVLTPMSILLIIWAFCYYPLALLNAGITERFFSTVNPWEGIQLALRMGQGFFKVFGYYLALSVTGLIITVINVYMIVPLIVTFFSSTLLIPIVNLFIALAICSLISAPILYINVVIAFLLGRVLFKNADQFGIMID